MDYEKMYQSYYMQVYSYVITLTRNREQAEEITQNTFYKAIIAKHPFRGNAEELTYLCSIAKNLFYDEKRHHEFKIRHTILLLCRKKKTAAAINSTATMMKKITYVLWGLSNSSVRVV